MSEPRAQRELWRGVSRRYVRNFYIEREGSTIQRWLMKYFEYLYLIPPLFPIPHVDHFSETPPKYSFGLKYRFL